MIGPLPTILISVGCPDWGGGANVGHSDRAEAKGMGGGRVHPKQNKTEVF